MGRISQIVKAWQRGIISEEEALEAIKKHLEELDAFLSRVDQAIS